MIQDFSLTDLGVQTWQARRVLPGAKVALSAVIYPLYRDQQQLGYLLLEKKPIEPKMHDLLAGIIKAIRCQPLTLPVQGELNLPAQQGLLVLGMGLGEQVKIYLQQQQLQTKFCIITHSLNEMLQQPLYKRKVWADLQTIV